MKIKVGVIFGGETVEHEVSIISAVQAMDSINKEKYDIVPIYIDKQRNWYTGRMLTDINVFKDMDLLKRYAKQVVLYKKGQDFVLQSTKGFKGIVETIDIAFPIVHGNNVEDGTLTGYLDTIGIPYVGSGVIGGALGQDKVIMKQVFEASDIPCVPYTWFYDNEYSLNKEVIQKEVKKIGYPVIVKPATLGSSIGITVVEDEEHLGEAVSKAINYDVKVIVEKMVSNLIEVNCSVLGSYEYLETSVLEEVMSKAEFLSYQDKYIGGSKGKLGGAKGGMANARRIIPARISEKMTTEIEEISKKAFKALNLSGICRIDFLVDSKSEKVYINEPNTVPGSLAFYLWDKKGKNYEQLLDELISLGIRQYKIKHKKVSSFNTNILMNFNGTKGKLGCKGKLGA